MRSPEADAWFAGNEHPVKDAMQRVRELIFSDGRITETTKSPTYQGNMASSNPRTKAHVRLAHRGFDPGQASTARGRGGT